MDMILSSFWWLLFYVSLAGNVLGWALTLLRILQRIDETFAKLCLGAQLVIPVGLVLAFIFGWLHGTADRHRRVIRMAPWHRRQAPPGHVDVVRLCRYVCHSDTLGAAMMRGTGIHPTTA